MKRSLGVCYYPEHWPEEVWAEDARRMVETGLRWVRIGEFAWAKLEPEEGRFDWAWLDRAVDTLGQAGLRVVMGTPSATPPLWMVRKFPDMLAIDAQGQPRKFGSRRHYCFSHLPYRAAAARMAGLMAARYGANPYVQAWQTDNEYACHDTTHSYSQAARAGFRDWLARRYQSPEALNRAWGNVFWSMEYPDFDAVDLPNLTVTEPNHPHVLDFLRYSSDQVVAFNRAQVDAIRAHTNAPIAHNYMGRELSFDHFAVGADLEIASWDSYPIGFLSDRMEDDAAHKRHFLRQGDPDLQAFHHDLYRAVGRGRWWVMEQQPGPVNWAPYNPAPLPGMARLWAWEAFAHGAETVCYFRWRQAPFAQEQMHAGLLRPDSQPAPALAEAAQVAQDMAELEGVEGAECPIAIVFDYDSAWAWKAQPQGRDFDYFRLIFELYRALRSLGLSVDFVNAQSPDFADHHRVIFVPGLLTLPEGLSQALTHSGARVIFGPRSNSKTTHLSIPTPLPPNLPGLDATIAYVESLPPDAPIPLEGGGAFVKWAEALEGDADVSNRRGDGAPAVMVAGQISYVGGWPDLAAWTRLIETLCTEEGIATTTLPPGLRLRDTVQRRYLFNYNPDPVTFDGVTLPPAGVHWMDRG